MKLFNLWYRSNTSKDFLVGEFHSDRTMTRYEMAEIIYNALSRGASAEKKLVEEFKPELQALAASNKATADAPAEKAEG